MKDYIQALYKKKDVSKAELLIMKVTNYAWSEMTLVEQQELREKAAEELASLRAENERLTARVNDLGKALQDVLDNPKPITNARSMAKSGYESYAIKSSNYQGAVENAKRILSNEKP